MVRFYRQIFTPTIKQFKKLGFQNVFEAATHTKIGEIVAEAHNRTRKLSDPTAHAEMLVLREAGILIGDWRLDGHTLYSTLEPCSMCTGAAVLSRIARLVFGTRDPKAGMCGSLENLAQDPRLNHHVELIEGVLAGESAYILQRFFQARRS